MTSKGLEFRRIAGDDVIAGRVSVFQADGTQKLFCSVERTKKTWEKMRCRHAVPVALFGSGRRYLSAVCNQRSYQISMNPPKKKQRSLE
ncbi:hypothetical protein MA16_Dca014210 [Dendrobium catenatum]|uniref:Uncharacterized protein n=1 Tax=Dendrobium catenatum TaxID=906689 RepID=A0A2I0VZA4_9ASPA|nr:hypothetical protein MA16_Dca014210 [Dendrobium catenatum]